MELAALVSLRPPEIVLALARAELPEVLGRLGNHVCEELELDPSEGLSCAWCQCFDNHVMDMERKKRKKAGKSCEKGESLRAY